MRASPLVTRAFAATGRAARQHASAEVSGAALSWVVGSPAVAVGEFVAANLGLDRGRHRSSDLRNHHEAAAFVDFRAAQCAIRRHDTLHRVAIVLDLGKRALSYGQRAPISVPVDRRWRIDRMNGSLRGIHGHAARRFEMRDTTGACAQLPQVCILPPPSGDAAISVACARPSRCKSSVGPASPIVTAFFRARLVPSLGHSDTHLRCYRQLGVALTPALRWRIENG